MNKIKFNNYNYNKTSISNKKKLKKKIINQNK